MREAERWQGCVLEWSEGEDRRRARTRARHAVHLVLELVGWGIHTCYRGSHGEGWDVVIHAMRTRGGEASEVGMVHKEFWA